MGAHCFEDLAVRLRVYLTLFILLLPASLPAPDAQGNRGDAAGDSGGLAGHAAGEAAKHGAEAAKAQQEGDTMKAAMETAMMLAQLAQMAAALAAQKKNKGGKNAAKAADPVKSPDVPTPSVAAKESPKVDLPTANPESAEVEQPELRGPEPAPVPQAIAQQIPVEHGEEMPVEVAEQVFDSEIPDTIPERAKLGYDERGDGTKPIPGQQYNVASWLGEGEKLYTPLDGEGGRKKKDGTASDAEGYAGEDSEGSGSGTGIGVATRGDFSTLLNQVLGKADGGPNVAGLGAGIGDGTSAGKKPKINHPQLVDTGSRNIFEYASLRYRELDKVGAVRKIPSPPILSWATSIFR